MLSGKMALTAENAIFYQVVYGSAISRLIGGLAGRGLDVIYNPDTGKYTEVGGGNINLCIPINIGKSEIACADRLNPIGGQA